MSGLDFVSSSNVKRDRKAMPQGQVTSDFLPLMSHDDIRPDKNASVSSRRPCIDRSQKRIEENDILFIYADVNDGYDLHAHGSTVKAFASHAGARYDMAKYTRVIGVAETQFIPDNSDETVLQSHSIRRVTTQRLRGQRKDQTLQVDYGTTVIASLPTEKEDREHSIDWVPEVVRSNFVARDLPLLEPLQKMTNKSIDSDAVFNRAANSVFRDYTNLHGAVTNAVNGTRRKTLALDDSSMSENDHLVWDDIDSQVVTEFREDLSRSAPPAFAKYLEGEPFSSSSSSSANNEMRRIGTKHFFAEYAQWLHSILSYCVSSEDYAKAQAQCIKLQIVMNWDLMRDGNGSSKDLSRLLSSVKLLQHSVSFMMMIGQEHIEQKCKHLVGMALEHGEFGDVIDMWVEPQMRR